MSSSFAVVAGALKTGINCCKSAYKRAQEAYGYGQGRVVQFCHDKVSPSVAETVKKMTSAVLEIIFCITMFTGVGKTVAGVLWAAQLGKGRLSRLYRQQ